MIFLAACAQGTQQAFRKDVLSKNHPFLLESVITVCSEALTYSLTAVPEHAAV